MIFSFLFPNLSLKAGKDIEKVRAVMITSNLSGSNSTALGQIVEFWKFIGARMSADKSLYELAQLARQDIFDAHTKPHMENKFFTNIELVEKQKQSGKFKMLLNDQQLAELIKQ